nr:hypothetical protein CFP56_72504 [Quercus suber]
MRLHGRTLRLAMRGSGPSSRLQGHQFSFATALCKLPAVLPLPPTGMSLPLLDSTIHSMLVSLDEPPIFQFLQSGR